MAEQELQLDSPSARVATSESFGWLDWLVRSVVVLNLLDAVFTLTWVRHGLAEEANIFMRDLAHEQALLFMLAKLALVSLGCLFLWGRRRHPWAVAAIFVSFAVYYLVLLLHLAFWSAHGLAFWNW